MNVDWPFLWAFLALLGLVLAPIRYGVGLVAPPSIVWVVSGLALVGCFLLADWLDRTGFRRLGAEPGGAGTFVALQFLVAPSIALAAVPAPGTPPWLAALPTSDPATAHPAWIAVFLVALPIAAWLSLYGGLARLGADVSGTTTFVLAWLSLAVIGVFVVAVVGDAPWAIVTRIFVGFEVVAAVVAYGPTRASVARKV